MFLDFLKMGAKIRIDGKPRYTPSTFDYHGGAVWVDNRELGYFPHPGMTKNPSLLDEHLKNMVEDGFTVTIIGGKA